MDPLSNIKEIGPIDLTVLLEPKRGSLQTFL